MFSGITKLEPDKVQ